MLFFQAAIRKELNEFKGGEMEVHEESKKFTRYRQFITLTFQKCYNKFFYILHTMWLGGRVVRDPDLRSTAQISAATLPSVTLAKLFTHMCLCHQAV